MSSIRRELLKGPFRPGPPLTAELLEELKAASAPMTRLTPKPLPQYPRPDPIALRAACEA